MQPSYLHSLYAGDPRGRRHRRVGAHAAAIIGAALALGIASEPGAATGAAVAGDGAGRRSVLLDARFEADRVYVDMPASRGPALRFFTDSGGGSLIMSHDAARRLGVRLRPVSDEAVLQELGAQAESGTLPAPARRRWPVAPGPTARVLAVPALSLVKDWPTPGDGILGHEWFAGHTWTWDYPSKRLWLRPPGWRPRAADARRLDVSFRSGPDGRRELDFARIEIVVDHRPLPVLFDTGASTFLTDHALQQLADGAPALRATSMITHSVFERWHHDHPEWTVVEDAQVTTHSRMILVADVEIAGFAVGPVWFTERPDRNFHEFMSQMTSGIVEGAAGGNLFRRLAVTVDYPRSMAWVELRASN